MKLAGKGGGEIEAEAIHMHFEDPVPQAIHDKAEY
jgi:hypothetical protein